jgi:hypothetical protein
MPERGVLGVFTDVNRAAEAVRALQEAGQADIRASMPAAFPDVVKAIGRPPSRLGIVTLTGAALGVALGLALCIGTSVSWPLITGGKPIVSIPPFIVIAFELSVLVSAFFNLGALIWTAKRGMRRRWVPFDADFSADRVGIFAAGGDSAAAESILRAHGAAEVRHVG